MVERNLGISILGSSAVKREAVAGWIKILSITDLELFRNINFIYNRDKQISLTLQLFIDFLSTWSNRLKSD